MNWIKKEEYKNIEPQSIKSEFEVITEMLEKEVRHIEEKITKIESKLINISNYYEPEYNFADNKRLDTSTFVDDMNYFISELNIHNSRLSRCLNHLDTLI